MNRCPSERPWVRWKMGRRPSSDLRVLFGTRVRRRSTRQALDIVRFRGVKLARRITSALPGAHKADAFLFPRHAEGRGTYSLATCWRMVCADAGLGRLRLHDLRHTAASQAVMAGENLPLVGKLLGHRRHRTTAGYAHLSDAHLVEAAEKGAYIIHRAMSNDDSSSSPLDP